MPRKRFTIKQIIGKLPEVEFALAKGSTVTLVCK
jgi:hypothetical protein